MAVSDDLPGFVEDIHDLVDAERIKNDPRLPFGLPGVNKDKRVSNGNYLWISYFWSYLNEKGRADLAKEARKAMPSLQQAVTQIQASPPLRDVLGPSMETMLEKLGQLMQ